jgi:pilus assembly protein Flp/PilA
MNRFLEAAWFYYSNANLPTWTPLAFVGFCVAFVFILFATRARYDESGQDLVEYALVVALIACGAVAATQGLSSELNLAFNSISADLASAL